MRNTGMHIKAMLIIVAALAFSVPAKAYYQPQEGRFMQRDPLGVNPAGGKQNPFAVRKQYSDGMNLYEYVSSNSLLYGDSMGLNYGQPLTRHPRTAEQCCKDANNTKIRGNTANGTVICCDGQKISCVWGTPYDDLYYRPPVNSTAEEIRKECAKVHEDTHHNHTKPCKPFKPCKPTLYRAKIKGIRWYSIDPHCTIGKYEVEAYEKQKECLKNSKSKCNELKDSLEKDACLAEIEREYQLVHELYLENDRRACSK